MKFTTEQPAFSKALTRAVGVVENRATIPILNNVMIEAADKVTLRSTDLDIEITGPVVSEVFDVGITTVPAKMLLEIVKKLPAGPLVTIEHDGKTLHIKSGRSSFKLATLPSMDFPIMASQEYESSFTMPGADLVHMMKSAQFAVSSEEMRYYLQGIYLHAVEGKIRAVATDGHRLAQLDTDTLAEVAGVIIPTKTIKEVVKLDQTETITVDVSETKIRFSDGTTTITSKVIDGTFPDYTRVIPHRNPHQVTVDADLLRDASDRVATVSSDRVKAVKLTFTDGLCRLSVSAQDEAFEEVDADYTGGKIEVGVNVKYLNEIIAQCSGGMATLHLHDSMSPVKITSSLDEKFLAVLMPMRL